jgi:hypothetical protein
MRLSLVVPRWRRLAFPIAVGALLAATGCGVSEEPAGPGPEKTEARLRQIAATTPTPIYYLGGLFHGWPLDDAIISTGGTEVVGDDSLDPGQTLTVGYGTYCSNGDCSWRTEVSAETVPLDGTVVGCSRLAPIRGVPAVWIADSVIVFTGELDIHIGSTPGDVKLAIEAVNQLRKVGETAPSGLLPPPPAAKLEPIGKACGSRPGEHGPELTW